MEPELIVDYQCLTGEGPLWHEQEQRLYWADIPQGRLFRYDPATGDHEQIFQHDEAIGGFTIQDDGALLLFMARGAVAIWRNGQLEPILEQIPPERTTRFNDVFADPAGRVFCGTMPTEERKGRLYRLDPDRKLTLLLEEIGISNGMGLTPDHKQLYYTDTVARQIYLFDYDGSTGNISNQRIFVDSTDEDGAPDGMTVDAEGCVWSARWQGGRITRYDPDGKELARITFPAQKITSMIFGGPDYSDMYVTSAGGDDKAANGPGAGALFRVRPGVKGVPEFTSKVR